MTKSKRFLCKRKKNNTITYICYCICYKTSRSKIKKSPIVNALTCFKITNYQKNIYVRKYIITQTNKKYYLDI